MRLYNSPLRFFQIPVSDAHRVAAASHPLAAELVTGVDAFNAMTKSLNEEIAPEQEALAEKFAGFRREREEHWGQRNADDGHAKDDGVYAPTTASREKMIADGRARLETAKVIDDRFAADTAEGRAAIEKLKRRAAEVYTDRAWFLEEFRIRHNVYQRNCYPGFGMFPSEMTPFMFVTTVFNDDDKRDPVCDRIHENHATQSAAFVAMLLDILLDFKPTGSTKRARDEEEDSV
jgi:hypothetical protein